MTKRDFDVRIPPGNGKSHMAVAMTRTGITIKTAASNGWRTQNGWQPRTDGKGGSAMNREVPNDQD